VVDGVAAGAAAAAVVAVVVVGVVVVVVVVVVAVSVLWTNWCVDVLFVYRCVPITWKKTKRNTRKRKGTTGKK